jgi:hypothetical protein
MIWLTQFLDSFRTPPPFFKRYHYDLYFQPGHATVSHPDSIRAVVSRAKLIPGHRIEVETQEDPADPREVGMAVERRDALRKVFLENSIAEKRLEMHVCPVNGPVAKLGECALLGEIRMFPRVASLSAGVGEPLLSFRELGLLYSARDAVRFPKEHDLGELSRRWGQVDWKRIVGYESLSEWVNAGAHDPLYDRF